ncbi:MAG: hypothetical protein GKR89_33150 [Candidatus Latescibacteria bacterium]|nr:hypothetical protein [Candidatus Latescibacterota bacterium]
MVPAQAQEAAPPVAFRWAFGALTQGAEGLEFVAVRGDTVLHTGDRLRLLVELKEVCHVYVLYQAPGGRLMKLYSSPAPELEH